MASLSASARTTFATPLGRRLVDPSPAGELLTELDHGRWLDSLRAKAASDDASAGLRSAVRSLEETIFALVSPKQQARETQEILIALGQAVRCIAQRPKLQETLRPPRRLSEAWIPAAGDGSAEFRLAFALAGLRMARGKAAR
jgi:CRISPR-associated protein Csx17